MKFYQNRRHKINRQNQIFSDTYILPKITCIKQNNNIQLGSIVHNVTTFYRLFLIMSTKCIINQITDKLYTIRNQKQIVEYVLSNSI